MVFQTPKIEPVPSGTSRPLWSVMIPTFNCAKYLRQTVESVLTQSPHVDQMQIEVVDDVSTKDDPEAVVREVAEGRVDFYRKPRNEGAIANFNTCIQRSRGHLVHILHGDDYVLPGFYSKLADLAKDHPSVSAFFVRCQVVEEDGSLDHISGRIQHLAQPSRSPGNLFYRNDLLAPGVVIRRSFYETHGGFLPSLVHTADWEMWVRAISQGTGLWINELLAAYRCFSSNHTCSLARTAENLRDYLRLTEIFDSNLYDYDRTRFRAAVAQRAKWQEKRFTDTGDKDAAFFNYKVWRELTPWTQRWETKLLGLLASYRRNFFSRSWNELRHS